MSEPEIDVLFKNGKVTRYPKTNLANVQRVFRDKIKKITDVITEQSQQQAEQDAAVLRETGKQLGIKGYQVMKPETLKREIEKKLKP